MKTILMLLILILTSCKVRIKEEKYPTTKEKKLKTLMKAELGNENFISYEKASIEIIKENDVLKIFKNKNLVTEINNKYSHLYQIFNKDFLIISISKVNTMAGISGFPRDSTYIYDTKKNLKGYISLKNISLDLNQEEIIKYYKTAKVNENQLHLAIDSINIEKGEVFLIQPNLEVKKYFLTKID